MALTAAIAFLAAGLLAYVPYAALSGILIYLAIRIFRLDDMINIYRHGRRETLLVVASAALVVVVPIDTGMLLAIILSFFHSLYIVPARRKGASMSPACWSSRRPRPSISPTQLSSATPSWPGSPRPGSR